MAKEIGRNDPCFCGSGKKYKICHSDVHPESRAARLINIYTNIDNKVKDYQESTGYIPPCHKGCFNCCYDDFSISEVEFEFIMREMKNWNEDIVKEVFDRALAQCDFLKEKNPEVWNNLEKYAHNNASIMGKQYEYHGKIRRNSFPCPLLNPETKACMVYDSRPIICRSHGTAHVNAHKHSNTEICEFIPESKQHAKQTPSVDHEQEEALSFINMKTPDGEIAHLRTYPIYYWFKIIYERTGEKKAQYNHYDDTVNFDRPIKQADYYTLKGFNTI